MSILQAQAAAVRTRDRERSGAQRATIEILWFARGTIVIVKISMTSVQAADMAQMAGSNRRGDVGHCSSVTAKK